MAIERKWESASQNFTGDGTIDGVIPVLDASGFYAKQRATLTSNTQPNLIVEVRRVTTTSIQVGLPGNPFTIYHNITAYLAADGAKIRADEQDKPILKPDEIWQAVYSRDPAVALRNLLVSKFGVPIDTVVGLDGRTRLAVDASVTIPSVTVALDAFTKVPADNAISVGTEDGTQTGVKHALKIGSDGNARVKDDAANTTLQSIDSKLTSPITTIGPLTDVELRASAVPISGTVALDATSLAALENINVTVTSIGEVEIKNDIGNPVPVSVASLPIPTGASTESKQDIANTLLTSIDSKLTSPVAVTGPLTDSQLRSSAVPVSATILPLPTGAATALAQTTANASLASIDSKLTSPLTVTNDPIKGTENGLPAGPQFTFVNNRRQQILAAKDRDQIITYADFGTKNQRVTLIDYVAPSIGAGAGFTARKVFAYVLDSGRYRRTNITWSLV